MYGVSIGYPRHTFKIVSQRMKWHCAQEGIGSTLVPLLSKERFYEVKRMDVRGANRQATRRISWSDHRTMDFVDGSVVFFGVR
jgi:hypothetical protein